MGPEHTSIGWCVFPHASFPRNLGEYVVLIRGGLLSAVQCEADSAVVCALPTHDLFSNLALGRAMA